MTDTKYDRRVTYTTGGRGFSADPEEVLMTAARMERDGWSLTRIRQELSLSADVTDTQLRNALKKGHVLLKQAIKEGREPEESVIDVSELVTEDETETYDPEVARKLGIWTPDGEA